MSTMSRTRPIHLVLALTMPFLVASCGSDGDDEAAAVDDGVLGVVMDDFHYGDLPDTVPVGTRIEVRNESRSEIHEFVALRLPDDDERPVDEIVADDLATLLAGGPPATVLLAPPGGEQIAAVGDGTLDAPGRYLIVCVIPTGADPDAYLTAAATSDGPPQVDGGAPHVANGMYAELIVN